MAAVSLSLIAVDISGECGSFRWIPEGTGRAFFAACFAMPAFRVYAKQWQRSLSCLRRRAAVGIITAVQNNVRAVWAVILSGSDGIITMFGCSFLMHPLSFPALVHRCLFAGPMISVFWPVVVT